MSLAARPKGPAAAAGMPLYTGHQSSVTPAARRKVAGTQWLLSGRSCWVRPARHGIRSGSNNCSCVTLEPPRALQSGSGRAGATAWHYGEQVAGGVGAQAQSWAVSSGTDPERYPKVKGDLGIPICLRGSRRAAAAYGGCSQATAWHPRGSRVVPARLARCSLWLARRPRVQSPSAGRCKAQDPSGIQGRTGEREGQSAG